MHHVLSAKNVHLICRFLMIIVLSPILSHVGYGLSWQSKSDHILFCYNIAGNIKFKNE